MAECFIYILKPRLDSTLCSYCGFTGIEFGREVQTILGVIVDFSLHWL